MNKTKTKGQKVFEKKCYDAYQLDWMMTHGFSLTDLLEAHRSCMKDAFDTSNHEDFSEKDLDKLVTQGRDDFVYERGFGEGSLFACMNEFLETEYLDLDYMKHLLDSMPDSEEMKTKYKEYTGTDLNTPAELVISSELGTMRVRKNDNPQKAGISVSVTPEGQSNEYTFSELWLDKSLKEKTYMKSGLFINTINPKAKNYGHSEVLFDDVIKA